MAKKFCTKCSRFLTLEEFGTHASWCKQCRNEYYKRRYQENSDIRQRLSEKRKEKYKSDPDFRQKQRQRNAEAYARWRLTLISKMGGVCVRCRSTDSLQFDHVDPASKEFDLNHNKSLPRHVFMREVKKCQLLCVVCHKEKTRQQLVELAKQRKRDSRGRFGQNANG